MGGICAKPVQNELQNSFIANGSRHSLSEISTTTSSKLKCGKKLSILILSSALDKDLVQLESSLKILQKKIKMVKDNIFEFFENTLMQKTKQIREKYQLNQVEGAQ